MDLLLSFLSSVHELSPGLKEHLLQVVRFRTLQKKEFLLRAGHYDRHIFFIESGLLRCYYEKGMNEVCSWFMQETDVVVSIESFYAQKPSYEYIQALDTTKVWYITYDELYHIYHTYPEFNYIGRELTQKYLVLWAKQLYGIRMQSARERYAWLLENFPQLALKVPAKYLASWLGITEVMLSKIKGKNIFF